MSFNRYNAALAMLASGLLAAGPLSSPPPYSPRNNTLLLPLSPRGSTPLLTPHIGRELSTQFDRQVIADNRTGGGGVIGWGAVAKAAPDGYTVLATELSFAIAAGLIPNLPFDPRKDFIHVTTATTVPHVLVITPSLP